MSVSLTVRVCVPETPDNVSMLVIGAGCVVPPAGAELLPASFAVAFPPPQPTKPPMPNRTKQNKPKSILLRLFTAINAIVPSGIITAAKAPIGGCRRDWGLESVAAAVVTDTVIGTAAPVTFTLAVLGVHELPTGAPVQVSATIPVNPETGATARL